MGNRITMKDCETLADTLNGNYGLRLVVGARYGYYALDYGESPTGGAVRNITSGLTAREVYEALGVLAFVLRQKERESEEETEKAIKEKSKGAV